MEFIKKSKLEEISGGFCTTVCECHGVYDDFLICPLQFIDDDEC